MLETNFRNSYSSIDTLDLNRNTVLGYRDLLPIIISYKIQAVEQRLVSSLKKAFMLNSQG